jgi:hypothetical protein
MQDLTIVVSEETGALAQVWEALADAGINVEAGCAFPRAEGRVVHAVVADEDLERAIEVLGRAGHPPFDHREVLLIPFDDQPGVLLDVTRRVRAAGARIDTLYLATFNRLVIGANDQGAARRALLGEGPAGGGTGAGP